ncbi:PREDICTED: uncharacterized protein LOC107331977 isoform X2 [Acropora digitifera]|uniref:uncharacterized protein LOC107331977 isoform X2 n=1 Tax=Acropora digitifera TaxID=70779 RepID=UPI00077A6ABF|nr:PREDICTED: uncharacterized protein LOC107331977 isoform X2 [Acropora digitifera]
MGHRERILQFQKRMRCLRMKVVAVDGRTTQRAEIRQVEDSKRQNMRRQIYLGDGLKNTRRSRKKLEWKDKRNIRFVKLTVTSRKCKEAPLERFRRAVKLIQTCNTAFRSAIHFAVEKGQHSQVTSDATLSLKSTEVKGTVENLMFDPELYKCHSEVRI